MGGGGQWMYQDEMATTAHNMLSMMVALLPEGLAWYKEIHLDTGTDPWQPSTALQTLLLGMCHEMAAVEDRETDLMNEKNPASTTELITDWERICGIPDDCTPNVAQTLEERREIVLAKVASRGGQDKQFYLDLCEDLGWPSLEILEFPPMFVGAAHCAGPCQPFIWNFIWAVLGISDKYSWARSGTASSGDYILTVDSEGGTVKCYLTLQKPAHTRVIFPTGAP
jgi:uncharacterized protein YmfQ (DUF2313 family)